VDCACNGTTNVAQPRDSNGFAPGETDRERLPASLALLLPSLGKALDDREDRAQNVFDHTWCNHQPVGTGECDLRGDIRIGSNIVDSGTHLVDPAQPLRLREYRRWKEPPEQNLCLVYRLFRLHRVRGNNDIGIRTRGSYQIGIALGLSVPRRVH
jgi:hypothetical protein